jgi:hypothetical protein
VPASLDASPPPLRTSPGHSVPVPGCSCSSACVGAPLPTPSPSVPASLDETLNATSKQGGIDRGAMDAVNKTIDSTTNTAVARVGE